MQVCAFTTLGMMIAAQPITGTRDNGHLLPTTTFKKEIDKLFKPHKLEKELDQNPLIIEKFDPADQRRLEFRKKLDSMGIAYDEMSTHSYRKGSASNAASGSTQGPPIVAICLRAGWKLGGVLNTYLCLENAGDQFVGRVAAGLPLLTNMFAVMPPRFPPSLYEENLGPPAETESDEVKDLRKTRQLIETAMTGMFGQPYLYGQSFAVVLRYCLASLCYHKQWLSALPPQHPWHTSWLAMNPNEWEYLRVVVGDIIHDGDDKVWRASGVPPYTMLARRLVKVEKCLLDLPDVLEERMSVLMDKKGVRAGNVTEAMMTGCVKKAVAAALADHGVHVRQQVQNSEGLQRPPKKAGPAKWHLWKKTGTMYKLPWNYVLTKDGDKHSPAQSRTPQQAYVRWWTPNNEKEITALRHVDFRDFSLQNQRKRFSDWKIVCEGLDTLLSWADVPLPDEKSVTVETVQKNFIKAFEMHNAQVKFLHPSKKKRARMRSRPQNACKLKVSTMARDMRAVRRGAKLILIALGVLKLQFFIKNILRNRAV